MYDKLFEALAKSTFRSRFKLKDKDKDYISQKGIDTINRMQEILLQNVLRQQRFLMTASKLLCAVILFLLHNTQPQPVAVAV